MIEVYIVDPFLRQLKLCSFSDLSAADRACSLDNIADRPIDSAHDALRTCLNKDERCGTWYFYCMECNKIHQAHGLGFIYGRETLLPNSQPADMPLMTVRAFRHLIMWELAPSELLKAAIIRKDEDKQMSEDIDTLLALLQREDGGDTLQ